MADIPSAMRLLLEQGMYSSVALLGDLYRSSTDGGSTDMLVMSADALVALGEHRRALVLYRDALQSNRFGEALPGTPGGGVAGGPGRPRRSPAAAGQAALPPQTFRPPGECEIKVRLARCYVALSETRQATSVLESIHARSRATSANLLLAQLYSRAGQHKPAIACFREVLRACPMALEAAIALARLGVSAREILALQPALQAEVWIRQLVTAHAAAAAHDAHAAYAAFTSLGTLFDKSCHVHTQHAMAAVNLRRKDEAISSFHRARTADPACLELADAYALCLRERGRTTELNRLCHEALATDRSRPEPWLCVSHYWAERNQRMRALECAERAAALDTRHARAHIAQGWLHIELRRPDAAVAAFRRAIQIRADQGAYRGIVEALIGAEQLREALAAAKEAVNLMPTSARAHTLVGLVHAASPDGFERSKRALAKAHQLDPTCYETVLAMVRVHTSERKFTNAISCLEPLLQTHHEPAAIHSKLGDLHALSHNFTQALSHYHHALSISDTLKSAQAGLERIERMSRASDKGVDQQSAINDGLVEPFADSSLELALDGGEF